MRAPAHARRAWVIMGVAVIAIGVVAAAFVRHYTSPEYVEKRLAAAIGSGYLIHIAHSDCDLLRRTFDATDISVVPDTLRPAPPSGAARPRRRSSFGASAVHASGVDFWALRKGRIDIDAILIDRPRVHLSINRAVPDPKRMKTRRMPHEVLMSSGTHLRIETIRIVDGDILYLERARDGARPGTFRFADLDATISNLTNDTTRMRPCVIDVQTRLADSGPLKATFEYYLASPVLRMDYHAAIGRMDALSLNKLLVNLKGIRIQEGTIDSTSLDIKVDGNVAAGTMRLLYHDLKFEILDKGTHEQSIGDHVASFVQSTKTHGSNPEDEDNPATVITLQRQRLPNISLIKFVWETVREGVLRTIGAQ